AENRTAGRSAYPILQHRLQILLSSGPEFKSARRTRHPLESFLAGVRIGLGQGLPVGGMACRRTDGLADRLLSRCVPADRSIEAAGTAGHAFLPDEWDTHQQGVVRIFCRG